MKKIPLTQGKYAIVDDSDYERLNKYKWYVNKIGHSWYAVRDIRLPTGKLKIYMHRFVLGLGKSDKHQIDHINHNGLDNRKANLRIVTRSQNHMNTITNYGTSKYKGISWHKLSRKWRAATRLRIAPAKEWLRITSRTQKYIRKNTCRRIVTNARPFNQLRSNYKWIQSSVLNANKSNCCLSSTNILGIKMAFEPSVKSVRVKLT